MFDHASVVSINGGVVDVGEEASSSKDEKRGFSRMALGKGTVRAVVVVSAVKANRIKSFWNLMVIMMMMMIMNE
jgi:hypothetical protein